MNDPFAFPNARLLIFAKAPVPGQVKTRLARCLGARGAAELYQRLLRRTLALASSARLCPVELWCAPDTQQGFFGACRRDYGVRLRRQCGGDLGRRMQYALNQALAESRQAVLIGGDCVSLDATALHIAFSLLAAGHDAVLGPATDGGYVLIGLRRPRPALFQGIAWSTSTVLQATRRRLRRLGMNWVELPTGWDVDTPADLRRLRRSDLLPGRWNDPHAIP